METLDCGAFREREKAGGAHQKPERDLVARSETQKQRDEEEDEEEKSELKESSGQLTLSVRAGERRFTAEEEIILRFVVCSEAVLLLYSLVSSRL